MKDIADLISQVGFPIVISILLMYQQQKTTDSYIQIVNSLKELISDNTTAIQAMLKNEEYVANKTNSTISQILGPNDENK